VEIGLLAAVMFKLLLLLSFHTLLKQSVCLK